MGLITGLLTLPLAPVRGTVWIAEKIQEQAEAEAEMNDKSAIRDALFELDAVRASGELPQDEIDAAEDALLDQLMAVRGVRTTEGDDGEGI